MIEPYHDCPYFDSCQENACPLSLDYQNLQSYPEDKELFGYKKCRARKNTRMSIAKKYNLKNLGLTNKEFKRYMKKYPQGKNISFSTHKINQTSSNSISLVEVSK